MPISAAYGGSELGPDSRRSGQVSEIVAITGSTGVATDQASYTCRHVHRNAKILDGAFFIASATTALGGTVLTIEALVALGNNTVYVEVVGDV